MQRLSGSSSSIPVTVKNVQMLFNVVWSFLLAVWSTVVRLCAELITRHIEIPNPFETRGSFFEKVISPWRILVQRRSTRDLEALFCGPFNSSKNRQFWWKSPNSLKLSKNLALNEYILRKCGPWSHLGWPTLFSALHFFIRNAWKKTWSSLHS